ncbi:SGNH/GDSL hydrolase family protein [Limosilactobacillus reuteri]|uniref:SGNH/GDSL hydrolase family protein n=1 Tax=Limosilactobacillus reuteri TaxID=1598 RepID=UPI001E2D8AD4|nr:SGNH/GDSL hydrolase family protein [Limosilactobacillus reuteri]MCC4514085.1 SGNH/GDSL hydrolase family protein [Limosilactobacillus reuteri]
MQTQVVTLDVLKPIGTTVDLSDSFNARVGDKMTPFQLFITEDGVAKDLKGMHPELEAEVGNGALRNGVAVMAAGAKGVHWVGSTNNVTGYNQLTLAFPAEVFPQSGFCYGHLILANAAGVRETSVDIWFQVLDGTPLMGLVADHYDSELQLELAKAKNANDQFSQEMRKTYGLEVTSAENALIQATNHLNSLAATAGDIEAKIKANDIATKNELANTQRGITTTLSQVAINPEAFDTLSALQQTYPNGKAGLFIVAENDHKYMYIDHTWKDCGPFVGAGLLDKSVNVNKLSQVLQDSLVPTVEEVPITGQWSGYVSIKTGHNVDNDDTYYSDAIPVTPGEIYLVNGTTYFDARTVILWDAKENIVGYFPQSLTDKELDSKQAFMFAIPQGAVTMYINTKKGNGNERHLYKVKNFDRVQDATTDFVSSVVNGKQAKYQPVKLTKCNNDGYWQYQYGYYQYDTDGTTKVVGYNQISIKPFETYRIKGNSYFEANLYNIYDYAGRLIESFPNNNLDAQFYDQTFTVPYNGAFLKVNQHKDGPEVALEKVIEWHDKSPIADKKWVAIGDSWTAANTLGNTVANYTNYVADRLGVTMVNAGVGGTGYVAQNGNYEDQFYNRQIPMDGDAYTIFGSFNDVFVDGFKFGNVGDIDKLTLWGGMKATLDHIWSIKDNAIVGIIAPGPWGAFNPQNENNWDKLNMKANEVGEQYVLTMKKFSDYYSLPFLDLYHQSGLRPWDSSFVAKYYHGTSDTDNTHPNTNGHKLFTSKIADFVDKLL